MTTSLLLVHFKNSLAKVLRRVDESHFAVTV